jgi:hypothetical protein
MRSNGKFIRVRSAVAARALFEGMAVVYPITIRRWPRIIASDIVREAAIERCT